MSDNIPGDFQLPDRKETDIERGLFAKVKALIQRMIDSGHYVPFSGMPLPPVKFITGLEDMPGASWRFPCKLQMPDEQADPNLPAQGEIDRLTPPTLAFSDEDIAAFVNLGNAISETGESIVALLNQVTEELSRAVMIPPQYLEDEAGPQPPRHNPVCPVCGSEFYIKIARYADGRCKCKCFNDECGHVGPLTNEQYYADLFPPDEAGSTGSLDAGINPE